MDDEHFSYRGTEYCILRRLSGDGAGWGWRAKGLRHLRHRPAREASRHVLRSTMNTYEAVQFIVEDTMAARRSIATAVVQGAVGQKVSGRFAYSGFVHAKIGRTEHR